MEDRSFEFLKKLLDAPGPSGFETAAARVWRAEAEGFAERVDVDVAGNSYARLGGGGPAGDARRPHRRDRRDGHPRGRRGFLYVDGIGGWDPQVLVAQRIRFLTRGGEVMGVVGKKPIHLIKNEDKEKAVKLSDLWVDVGAADRATCWRWGIRVGDPGVVDAADGELGAA
jgi:putative aminopeptidase FrvX